MKFWGIPLEFHCQKIPPGIRAGILFCRAGRAGYLQICFGYRAGGYCQNPSGRAGGSGIFGTRPITNYYIPFCVVSCRVISNCVVSCKCYNTTLDSLVHTQQKRRCCRMSTFSYSLLCGIKRMCIFRVVTGMAHTMFTKGSINSWETRI